MKEKHKNTLEKGLRDLPVYQPPGTVWENIAAGLDLCEAELPLRTAIRQLPVYEPPDQVWKDILSHIEQPKTAPRVFRLSPQWGWAAAVIILAVISVLSWPKSGSPVQVSYQMEEKRAANINMKEDWNADEELISQVLNQFENSAKALQSSEYETLKMEWQDLDLARQELETIMRKYGKDTEVIQQLKEIELERSTIVKKMASLI